MSQEDVRKRNAQLVIEKTMELGLQKGVNNVSVRDAAQTAGLTERSVYRYFENRGDLIYAAASLFWEKVYQGIDECLARNGSANLNGYQRAELLLRTYSRMYLEWPECVRFICSAEVELQSNGLSINTQNHAPKHFETSNTPMACALRLGQEDGSISKDIDIKMFYYNAYDALLGTVQRHLLDTTGCDLDVSRRLDYLCRLFLRALKEPI